MPRMPIPWFGYKGAVSKFAWAKLGDVPNFVSPFIGAGGVYFNRPAWHAKEGIETVNDLHAELANCYRAVKRAPEAVAAAADWQVSEIEITARWRWSKARVRNWAKTHGGLSLREWLEADPYNFCPQLAGIYLWGVSATIGNAWDRMAEQGRTPRAGRAGTQAVAAGVDGVHNYARRGLHGGAIQIGERRAALTSYMRALAERMTRTTVLCGDFERALRPSVVLPDRMCGVFLDPEYDGFEGVYADKADEQAGAFRRCTRWVHDAVSTDLTRGNLRVILCGYDGDFEVPKPWTPSRGRFKGTTLTWETVAWKSSGYGERSEQGKTNQARERIWCSPHCLPATSMSRMLRTSKASGGDGLSRADPRQQGLF